MAKPALETVSKPPARKVCLTLGSGSARGLAHIGVLRAIKEAGIEIDVIAGTGMGALIGAIFAAGKLDGLAARFLDVDWKDIVPLLDPAFPWSGLIDGQKIADFVRAHVLAASIKDLPIPFRAVATCIMSGEEVACGAGDLIEAVRASISVPGIFTPLRSNGRILVDDGLIDPVPVSVVRAMVADLVIAVDLNHDIVASRVSHPDSRVKGKP
ncbi:MAG: patatin-like phospholipase family protein [Burkholderiaceae bacterium]|nr:patatin-like phospholipase family protein [Burkholderiaceae bacterium]